MEPRIHSIVLTKTASQDTLQLNDGEQNNYAGVWTSLFVLVLCPIGGYLSYDAPGALSLYYTNDIGLSLTALGGLYTAYAVPCVLLSPFCGTLAYYFGAQRMLVGGNILAVMGALGFVFTDQYWSMILMRVLFGVGLEILLVAVPILIEEWFRNNKHLGLAFGLVESFPLLGTLLAFGLLPMVAQQLNTRYALLVAFGFCFVCLLASIAYMALLHHRLKSTPQSSVTPRESNIFVVHINTIKKAKKEFWLLCGFCFAMDSTAFPFLAMAGQFFYDNYGFSETYSTRLVCVFCAVAIIGSPILNFGIDRVAIRRVSFGMIAALLNFMCFLIFAMVDNLHPAFPLVVSSLAYVTGCGTVFNLASLTAETEAEIGILFSILSVFPNLTFLLMPLIFGYIKDYTGEYLWSCLFFAFVDLIGLACMITLKLVDTCNLDAKITPQKAN